MAQTARPVQLKSSTVEAFDAYLREAEAGMEQTLHGSGPFLWSDVTSDRAEQVRQGQLVAQRWSGNEPVKVPDGLIHDWIGAAFILGTTVKQTVALVQDYNNTRISISPR
jgi:hypothetical protein